MCLTRRSKFRLNKYGYKVFDKIDKRFCRSLFYKDMKFEFNKVYKDNLSNIIQYEVEDEGLYKTGYHIFNSLIDALAYYKFCVEKYTFEDENPVLVQVEYKNVVAKGVSVEPTYIGYSELPEHRIKTLSFDVVVARTMKLLKEINVEKEVENIIIKNKDNGRKVIKELQKVYCFSKKTVLCQYKTDSVHKNVWTKEMFIRDVVELKSYEGK